MNRDYSTGESQEVSLFVGTEVEHTPAFGKKTLFVVGVQHAASILLNVTIEGTEHIYLGANQSFNPPHGEGIEVYDAWRPWDKMITDLLKAGHLVTLDFDVSYIEAVLEHGWSEYINFIPMISVKLPYIQQLGYNASLKIDDKDFKATNPGVWVHQVHDLMDRSKFTDWGKYTQDRIVEYKVKKEKPNA